MTQNMGYLSLTRLLQRGVMTLVIRLAGVALSLAITVWLSRILDVAEFGRYSFLYSLAAILVLLAQMGLPEYLMRETAKHFGATQTVPRLLWRRARNWTLVSSILVLGLAFSLIAIGKFPTGDALAFLICVFIVPLSVQVNLLIFELRGVGKSALGQTTDMIFRPIIVLGALLIMQLVTGPLNSAKALATQAMGVAGALLILWFVIRQSVAHLPSTAEGAVKLELVLGSSVYLGLVSGLYLLQSNIDILMLGFLRPEPEVAVYKVASTIAGVAALGLMATNYVIAPNLSALYQTGDHARLRMTCKHSAQMSFVAAISAALGLALFGSDLLTILFGAGYSIAFVPLMVLIAAPTARAMFGPIENLLSAAHCEKDLFLVLFAAAVGNVVLNALLIPSLGSLGAALSTSVTIFSANLTMWRMGIVKLGIDSSVFQ